MKLALLLIDPQNDFCDLPATAGPLQAGARLRPALPVPGADADMNRAAALIDQLGERLDAITVTLDSHQRLDIAHPGFWIDASTGLPPAPFTPISAAALREGLFRPREAAHAARALAYAEALERSGRYTLMVWPAHCQIGSWGQAIHAELQAALDRWSDRLGRSVQLVHKGENRWTEHYSALQAEVPDPDDAGTQLNRALLARLDEAEQLLIAGEAGSHCVRATVEHLVEHLPSRRLDKLVLLSDCISPVGGFEAAQAEFFAAMQARGLRLTNSQALLATLGLVEA